MEALVVSPQEAGQKILNFLARRFDAPPAMLHRWLRSGQVRRNGGRIKPFDRVAAGDLIRVPPFAEALFSDVLPPSPAPQPAHPVEIVADLGEILLVNKPAGLPVHPGSGHHDSLSERLARLHPEAPFRPTPAHRLDRDTSGLLAVALSYAALRRLNEAFARHDDSVIKEYLAWATGRCPWDSPCRLEDRLEKGASGSRERVLVGSGQQASLSVRRVGGNTQASLLLLRLHTGRTHQIRAQLAARGHPLLGDRKYGGPPCPGGLKLHAARLILDGVAHEVLPPWQAPWAVDTVPPPIF